MHALIARFECIYVHMSAYERIWVRLALGWDFEFPQKTTNEFDNSECFSIKNGLDLRPGEYKITSQSLRQKNTKCRHLLFFSNYLAGLITIILLSHWEGCSPSLRTPALVHRALCAALAPPPFIATLLLLRKILAVTKKTNRMLLS